MAVFHDPVIPFVDVFGKIGTLPPAQITSEVPKLNVGVMLGATVTVNVTGSEHAPAEGVNVYTPEAWLSTVAGLHVPVIPFVEVVGKEGTLAPAQIESEVPKLKTGVIIGLTVTLNAVVVAHWPIDGVKVYVSEF